MHSVIAIPKALGITVTNNYLIGGLFCHTDNMLGSRFAPAHHYNTISYDKGQDPLALGYLVCLLLLALEN